jgi:hypothetical protein
LKAAQDGAHHLIENDGVGRYRLGPAAGGNSFQSGENRRFPDWEIQQTAERLSNLQPERAA